MGDIEHRQLPSYSELVRITKEQNALDAYHDRLWDSIYGELVEEMSVAMGDDFNLVGKEIKVTFNSDVRTRSSAPRPPGWGVNKFAEFVHTMLHRGGYPVSRMSHDKGSGPEHTLVIMFDKIMEGVEEG